MNLRKLTIPAILLALSLTSCGTARRAGKDLFITAITPVNMIYGGGTDAVSTAEGVRTGVNGGAPTEVLAMVPAFVYHAVKHGIYGIIHAVDFCLFPVYGAADLHPYGPEIQPLDYYTGTWFDETKGDRKVDSDSGETAPHSAK
ncbi:MAG: hypothetical protein U1F36_03480 [Planctomycetota bacterium]